MPWDALGGSADVLGCSADALDDPIDGIGVRQSHLSRATSNFQPKILWRFFRDALWMPWDALGCSGMLWDALRCCGLPHRWMPGVAVPSIGGHIRFSDKDSWEIPWRCCGMLWDAVGLAEP